MDEDAQLTATSDGEQQQQPGTDMIMEFTPAPPATPCQQCKDLRAHIHALETSYHDLLFQKVFHSAEDDSPAVKETEQIESSADEEESRVLPPATPKRDPRVAALLIENSGGKEGLINNTPRKPTSSNLSKLLPAVQELQEALAEDENWMAAHSETEQVRVAATWDDILEVIKLAKYYVNETRVKQSNSTPQPQQQFDVVEFTFEEQASIVDAPDIVDLSLAVEEEAEKQVAVDDMAVDGNNSDDLCEDLELNIESTISANNNEPTTKQNHQHEEEEEEIVVGKLPSLVDNENVSFESVSSHIRNIETAFCAWKKQLTVLKQQNEDLRASAEASGKKIKEIEVPPAVSVEEFADLESLVNAVEEYKRFFESQSISLNSTSAKDRQQFLQTCQQNLTLLNRALEECDKLTMLNRKMQMEMDEINSILATANEFVAMNRTSPPRANLKKLIDNVRSFVAHSAAREKDLLQKLAKAEMSERNMKVDFDNRVMQMKREVEDMSVRANKSQESGEAYEKLKREKAAMELELASHKNNTLQMSTIMATVSSLNDTLAKRSADLDQAKRELQQANLKLSAVGNALNVKESQFLQMKNHNERLSQTQGNMERELKLAQADLSRTTNELKLTHAKLLEVSRNKETASQGEVQKLQKRIEVLEREKVALEAHRTSLEKEKITLSRQKEILEQNHEAIQLQNETLTREKCALLKQKQTLEHDYMLLKKQGSSPMNSQSQQQQPTTTSPNASVSKATTAVAPAPNTIPKRSNSELPASDGDGSPKKRRLQRMSDIVPHSSSVKPVPSGTPGSSELPLAKSASLSAKFSQSLVDSSSNLAMRASGKENGRPSPANNNVNTPASVSASARQQVSGNNNTTASVGAKKQQPVVVSFSGFRDDSQVYNVRYKDELTRKLQSLGAKVKTDGEFEESITHVITPPNSRTLKTFAAALTSKWLITNCQWVIDSHQAGHFVPESKYGDKFTSRPFQGKRYYLADSFLQECRNGKEFRIENAKNLISLLGGGSIVYSYNEADCVLRSADDPGRYSGKSVYNWIEFLELIPVCKK